MPAPNTPFQPYAANHKDIKGPGDARPTALQITKDLNLTGKLHDKVILITGASAGIGTDTAKALHTTGAKLYLTFRDKAKGEAVVRDIVAAGPLDGRQAPELLDLDLSDFSKVREAARQFLAKSQRLDILINNAGIMAVPESRTVDGFEAQLGSNHFGHFLLFQLLRPTLLASGTPNSPSRVVNVSSSGHRGSGVHFDDLDLSKQGYHPLVAYAQSKTANIYMANSIDRRYGSRGLRALSLHPGVIFTTELGRHMSKENMDALEPLRPISKSAEQGAATTVWAALSPRFNDKGGVYLADVGEAGPAVEGEIQGGPGYAPHAYDEEAEERLWRISCQAVGVEDD